MNNQSINNFSFSNPSECFICNDSPSKLWSGHKVASNKVMDHWMCLPCATDWFKKENSCPICRISLFDHDKCYSVLSQGEWVFADQVDGYFKQKMNNDHCKIIAESTIDNKRLVMNLIKNEDLETKKLIALISSESALKKEICLDLILHHFEANLNDLVEIAQTLPQDQQDTLLFFKSKYRSPLFQLQLGADRNDTVGICNKLILSFHPSVFALPLLASAIFLWGNEFKQCLSLKEAQCALAILIGTFAILLKNNKIAINQKGSPQDLHCAKELALTLENDDSKTLICHNLISHGSPEAFAYAKEIALTLEDPSKANFCVSLIPLLETSPKYIDYLKGIILTIKDEDRKYRMSQSLDIYLSYKN